MLGIEDLTLHGHEHEVGVEAVDHKVGGVGQQRVVMILVDIRCSRARLTYRHTH
jgi:hypothetical protein